jgi:hypothetical protein
MVDEPDDNATAITFEQFANNSAFVEKTLNGWWGEKCRVLSAQLLVHRCTGCERLIVIDGIHRLVAIISRRTIEADLYITELAGAEWPEATPDMRRICICKKLAP